MHSVTLHLSSQKTCGCWVHHRHERQRILRAINGGHGDIGRIRALEAARAEAQVEQRKKYACEIRCADTDWRSEFAAQLL